jgi:hypothetical protein
MGIREFNTYFTPGTPLIVGGVTKEDGRGLVELTSYFAM